MRTALRGSMLSTPVTGQPPAQVPQVRQTSANLGLIARVRSLVPRVYGSWLMAFLNGWQLEITK